VVLDVGGEMNRSRSHGIVLATVAVTSVASVALAVATLSGFGSSAAGDLAVSSTPMASTVLIIIGILVMIELEWAHVAGRRRSSRAARAPMPEPARLSRRAA
jgi:hypothetical protein